MAHTDRMGSTWFTTLAAIRASDPDWEAIACYREPVARFLRRAYPRLKPDVVQKVTFALTHMYFNWPGNVKVPAPCQYAHKLVEMVGEHLHKQSHPALAETLFYL